MEEQGSMLYNKKDKMFYLTEKNLWNSSMIVVTGNGEMRLGHDNALAKQNSEFLAPYEYIYFDIVQEALLKDILLEKDVIKGLLKHYENIPSNILRYLIDANLNELKNVLEYYQQISKPKKYILIDGGCNNFEDEIKISSIKDVDEVKLIIESIFEDENYYGFFNMNLKNSGYWFSVIVTDDERINCKYRDVLSYDEFKTICLEKFNEETFRQFERVWNLETKRTEKFWRQDRYDDEGQTFYSKRYSLWTKE